MPTDIPADMAGDAPYFFSIPKHFYFDLIQIYPKNRFRKVVIASKAKQIPLYPPLLKGDKGGL
jgi:hypothetical protein